MAPPKQKIAWFEFQFDVPNDWEITFYSLVEKKGRLEFNDRHEYHARIMWRKCKGIPDEERILFEFHGNYLRDHEREKSATFSKLNTSQIGRFNFASADEGDPCYASLYLPTSQTLLIWTFPAYHPDKLKNIWMPLLHSFSENNGALRHWSAWGLDFALPSDFDPSKAVIYPANVTMLMQSSKRMKYEFHRWGLPNEILKEQPLQDWYQNFLVRSNCKINDLRWEKFRGHDAILVDYTQRGEFDMDVLYGKWWEGRAICWHNVSEMRIYACEQIGPRKQAKLEFNDVLLYPGKKVGGF